MNQFEDESKTWQNVENFEGSETYLYTQLLFYYLPHAEIQKVPGNTHYSNITRVL